MLCDPPPTQNNKKTEDLNSIIKICNNLFLNFSSLMKQCRGQSLSIVFTFGIAPNILHISPAALGYLPWYCEGTREGRPLRACLILLASFHSIAGGAKQGKISPTTDFHISWFLAIRATLSGITGR